MKDSGRVLESEEDLLLLLRIYKDQGKYREGLNILDDTQKGFASPIGKCSWDLAMQMIELHGLCENWEFQYHICHEILQESRPSMFNCETSGSKLAFGNRGDDWKVWITLVAAAGKLLNSKPELVLFKLFPITANDRNRFLIKTEHLILGFAEPRSRNASLAAISLHLQAGSEVLALERGYKNIKTYFEDYGTKTACFQELRPHLESLSRSHQEMLVTDVRQFSRKNHELRAPSKVTIAISLPDLADRCQASCANHIIRETNSLKIDYYLLISRTNEQDQSRMVFSFVKTCLKLYKSSLVLDLRLPQSDRGPADDAAILAAVALMRLYIAGNKKAIFHSVLILEYLLSHSKHNYEALLILIRLYLHLGNGSLAIDRFSRLSIKNIQHASIAWVLFTRLSTIHPWAANLSPGGPSPGPLDPLQELETGLRWHEKAGGLTDNALHANIRNEQWGMILGLFDVQNAIQNGFGRTTLAVEYLRLQRLRTNAQDRGRYFAKIPSPPLKDNRDRSVFPKYESTGQAALDEFLPTSSFPLSLDLQWLVRELHLANLWDCLGSRLWSQTDLENLRRLAQSSTVDSVDSLTGSEKMADDILNLLSGIVRPLSASSGPIDAEETLTRLDDLGKRLRALWRTTEATGSNPSQGTLQFGKDHSLPLWVTLHHEFTLIEIALFIRRGMNWMKAHYASVEGSKKSEILEQVTGVASGCRTLLENIHSQASIWRETIPAFGFEELMTGSGVFNDEDDNLVKEIPRLIGREMVTSVCEKMKESYLDAIRGLLRSSLPPSL